MLTENATEARQGLVYSPPDAVESPDRSCVRGWFKQAQWVELDQRRRRVTARMPRAMTEVDVGVGTLL